MLPDVGEEYQPRRIGTENFADQRETQQGHVGGIAMGTWLLHARTPLYGVLHLDAHEDTLQNNSSHRFGRPKCVGGGAYVSQTICYLRNT